MLRDNFGYKLFAVAVAVVIWAFASQAQNPGDWQSFNNATISRVITLPLSIRRLEPGCVVTSIPKRIKVRIQGRREYIDAILAEPDLVSAYVNLADASAGRHKQRIILRTDGYMGLITATPDPFEVWVRVENQVERSFDAGMQLSGHAMEGYVFGTPEILPAKVVAKGIERNVNAIWKVVVPVDPQTIGPSGADGSFRVAAIDRSSRTIPGIQFNPAYVHLKFDIESKPERKVLFINPNLSGQPLYPSKVAKVEILPQMVTVTGSPEALAKVGSIETEPVKLSGKSRSFRQRAQLILPPGVSAVEGASVLLSVEIAAPENAEHSGQGATAP